MAENDCKPIRLEGRIALRPREAAAALGVSERAFRTMLPRLPHVREGGVLMIPVRELQEWLRERARQQAAAPSKADRILGEIMEAVRRGPEGKDP